MGVIPGRCCVVYLLLQTIIHEPSPPLSAWKPHQKDISHQTLIIGSCQRPLWPRLVTTSLSPELCPGLKANIERVAPQGHFGDRIHYHRFRSGLFISTFFLPVQNCPGTSPATRTPPLVHPWFLNPKLEIKRKRLVFRTVLCLFSRSS